MKKTISAALAASMMLGMGLNAFADISYNSGAAEDVDWDDSLCFDGNLVINRDDVGTGSVWLDDTEEDAEFRPGDTIYMPLYADDQVVYTSAGGSDGQDYLPAVTNLKLDYDADTGEVLMGDTVLSGFTVTGAGTTTQPAVTFQTGTTVPYDGYDRTVTKATAYSTKGSDGIYTVDYILVNLRSVASVDAEDDDTLITDGTTDYGPYTGKIGKDWSINFIEKSENFVEKASFYRAKASDSDYLVPNAWYVKVQLKDTFDSVDEDEVYYKVYISENGTQNATNKVYVKGTYANEVRKYVDFEWTNNANTPAVWQVEEGENGTAVFDFNDQAFFTVKMYSDEKIYLNLDTSYQKDVAADYDADFDSFYDFVGSNANFSRQGELILESDDPNLNVYEIVGDNELIPVDAEYVEDYQITHTNDKINGYVFRTKELGNYVLSADQLEVEEQLPDDEQETTVDNSGNGGSTGNSGSTETGKVNPDTGAGDFVGVAATLAILSVAGAGALALKK